MPDNAYLLLLPIHIKVVQSIAFSGLRPALWLTPAADRLCVFRVWLALPEMWRAFRLDPPITREGATSRSGRSSADRFH